MLFIAPPRGGQDIVWEGSATQCHITASVGEQEAHAVHAGDAEWRLAKLAQVLHAASIGQTLARRDALHIHKMKGPFVPILGYQYVLGRPVVVIDPKVVDAPEPFSKLSNHCPFVSDFHLPQRCGEAFAQEEIQWRRSIDEGRDQVALFVSFYQGDNLRRRDTVGAQVIGSPPGTTGTRAAKPVFDSVDQTERSILLDAEAAVAVADASHRSTATVLEHALARAQCCIMGSDKRGKLIQ